MLNKEGLPSTDPLEAREKGGFLTSLGGSPENSSYKGYGLAAMVNILASCLSGATLITDPQHTKKPQGMDIGHFFMAIDPGLFRTAEEFQSDVARFCGDLRATKPVDPAQPVMVAGDPQWNNAEKRMAEGIPVGPGPARPGAADRPGIRRAVAAGLAVVGIAVAIVAITIVAAQVPVAFAAPALPIPFRLLAAHLVVATTLVGIAIVPCCRC